MTTENDKSPRWRVGCGLCASVFASIVVIVIVYRNVHLQFVNDNSRYRNFVSFLSAVIAPKLFEFRYPTLRVILVTLCHSP